MSTRTATNRPSRPSPATRPCTLLSMLLGACLAMMLALAGRAQAGEWVQVSCINPNQSAASSQGWTSFITGSPGYGSNNSTSCDPSSPMYAILSSAAAAPVGAGENLQYTPPGGSTLTGGNVDLSMLANGHGYDASGTAVAYTPEFAYDGGSVFFQCAAGLSPCADGGNEFTGILALPTGRGGNLYIGAGCGGNSGASCDEGASQGAWALVDIWWAELTLENDATPAASNIAGTLLQPGARASSELTLTASDPDGPGVYQLTVQIDGQNLYSGTPDSNGGACAPVGEQDGALMFDHAQPCKQNESLDIPIDTTSLPDGQHTLKVTVTDAAGNSSVVYDGTISTENAPAESAPPTITSSTQTQAGVALTATPGEWSDPAGAGTISYSYQWQSCDSEGGDCQTIPGSETSSYTPTASEVGHTLRVSIDAADNDGLTTITSSPTAAVLAAAAVGEVTPLTPTAGTTATATASGSSSSGGGGGTTTTDSPASVTSTGSESVLLGAANGSPASNDAHIQLAAGRTIVRSYARRALTLTGKLTDSTGQPISGATVALFAQNSGSAQTVPVASTQTAADGSFTVHVPAGPSRTLSVTYRAFAADGGYSAQASIKETVGAAVRLTVTPRHTGPAGTIILRGDVQGPIPSQGVVVELLVHYLGAWEPFRDPRTNRDGQFIQRYRFQGASGRFPFRAQVLGGQAGFPYSSGESRPVDVATN